MSLSSDRVEDLLLFVDVSTTANPTIRYGMVLMLLQLNLQCPEAFTSEQRVSLLMLEVRYHERMNNCETNR